MHRLKTERAGKQEDHGCWITIPLAAALVICVHAALLSRAAQMWA